MLELPQPDLWEASSVTPRRKNEGKEAEPTSLSGDCLGSYLLVTQPMSYSWRLREMSNFAQGHTTGLRTRVGTHSYTVLFP